MDRLWWNEYGREVKTKAELWTTNREAARIYRLNFINGEIGGGLAKRPNAIRLGGNSGYQAVALAVHFGAAQIVLLGYDMQNQGRQSHWHGNHQRLGNPMAAKFPAWIAHFEALKREVGKACRIVNATRETALRTFKRSSLDACLAEPPPLGP